MLGMAGAAPAATTANVAAAQVEAVTLRLAGEPGQDVNIAGASEENGARAVQWPVARAGNDLWEPEAAGGGYYRLKSVGSGKCLNVKGGGNEVNAEVIQYTCSGGAANEEWRFVPKGIGYQIVVRSSGQCLNVRGGVGKGNQLIQYTCTAHGVANDTWLPVWEHASR
ncbi:ricin B lectin [Streptomyces sp. MMG1121]|nr:ricin B lectin [Streptomyces sp. MMG1121]